MRSEGGRFLRGRSLRREEGQALTEYALVLAILVAACVALAAVPGLGQSIVDLITSELGKVLP
jgi:Flp pilus assembly pilin Flp